MPDLKIHVIHAGSVRNKGTQALLRSDIIAIRNIAGADATVSVSTVDIGEARRVGIPASEILPPMVDIPHDKADVLARRLGCKRDSITYKALVMSGFFWIFPQIIFSILSTISVRFGLRPFYRAKVLKTMNECDLVISCSDENFKEGASLFRLNVYWSAAWWSMLVSRVMDIVIAKSLRKKIVMFPNSVGPFRTWVGESLARLALNSLDCMLIRDPISYKIVQSMSLRPPVSLTYDMALLFEPARIEKFHKSSSLAVGAALGVYSHVFSDEEFYDQATTYAKALDKAVEKYGVSVFLLPHYISGFRFDDLQMCELIQGKMKNQNNVRIVALETVDEFKNVLDTMDMVITSKMHPGVLATTGYVPTLSIAYDQKQVGYFEQLNMPECILPISEISQKLSDKIDYVWSNREKIRTSLEKRIPLMQEELEASLRNALKLAW